MPVLQIYMANAVSAQTELDTLAFGGILTIRYT